MKSYCLLVLVFYTAQAHLSSSNLCSRYCKDNKNTFNYKIGYSYEYKYTGSVISLVHKNAPKQHEANFTANFKIRVLSPCDFEMRVNSVEIKDENDRNFEKSLARHPLQFSFQNGKIATICPSVEEITPILNIKRGILSSFQTNLENNVVFETDVSGTCETKYEILENKNVKKTKDLTSCNKRSSKQFSWHSEVYDRNQARFSSPLLKSTQGCVQVFKNNILHNVDCVEKHLFRPFSNGENGASTILKQQVRFIKSYNVLNHPKKHQEFLQSTLVFEREPPRKTENYFEDVEVFRNLMLTVQAKTKNGIEREVPELFSRLVHMIENSKRNVLLDFFQEIKHSNIQKKFFVDAISVTKTIETIHVMKKMYEENEISHHLFNSWITSLSFVKNPSKDYIYSLGDMIDLGNPTKRQVYLSISGLIHQYCKSGRCDNDFSEILEKISKPIQYKCAPVSSDHHQDILLSLKTIGNSGRHSFGKYLRKCYLNPDVPIDLKVAAIQAHRRINCDQNENLQDFENLFSNVNENSEVRINSYLAMMRCSSYSTFEKIKYVLDEEETNQVGSFVWSHLVNLQRTETFWKRDLKKLIENEGLKTKFSTDPRKYSRNYEVSTFFDEIDTGVGVEGNVIFTQESYLPKSAMLNFTLDMFGETINPFEIGARIEGFEEIVENIFGPKGYFPEKSIKAFLENQRNEFEEASLTINPKIGLKKSPNGLLYSKIFGHEVSFAKFRDFEEILGKPTNVQSFLHGIINFLKDVEYSKSLRFLDTKYEIPTILGFPLELSVNGTAILGLTTKVNINIEELRDYKFEVEGKISPSVSVRVIGNMNVDTHFAKLGLKSISTLNSNTFIDGSIKVDRGKLVDIKINTPQNHIDIINIESDVFFVKDDEMVKIDNISVDGTNQSDCTGSHFEQVTGMKLCHNLKYVNASSDVDAPYFPLTGSFKYSITAKKMDTFEGYILKWTSQKNYEQGIYGFSFNLDTPNSSINRQLSAFFLLDIPEEIIELKMSSRFMTFNLLGKMNLNPRKLSFSINHSFDQEEIINLQATLSYVVSKYDLNVDLNYKKQQIFLLRGDITPTPTELTSTFHVKVKKKYYILDSFLRSKDGFHDLSSVIKNGHTNGTTGSLTIQLTHDQHKLSLVAESKYTTNNKEETVSLTLNTWKGAALDYNKYGLYLKFDSSQKPEYNALIDLETRQAFLHYDLKGVVSMLGNKWETRQLVRLLKDYQRIDASIISSLTCSEKNIDYVFITTYNTSALQNFARFLIQLNNIQRIELMYDFKRQANGNRNLEMLFYVPRNLYKIKGEVVNINPEDYLIKLIGEREFIGKEIFLEVNGTCFNSTRSNLQNYSLSGKFDLQNGFLKTPWNFKMDLQIADDILAANVDLQASDSKMLTQLSWAHNSFSATFKFNNKRIFFTNVKWSHEVEFSIGVNVYQNFELSMTFQPKTKMDVVFYWNKDRDRTRKVYLNLQNFGGGIYTMELEYPTQKVAASFTLQSTQITLNITWGLQTYQKIFLNLGSKVYDLGGIWYGELETPFKYFEKQQFNIKYLIMQNNINVEIKVFWKEHRIDFGLSGSRSSTHVDGKLEMRTTLPEIYKIGLGISHKEHKELEIVEKTTNITMIYNQHRVVGFSHWVKTGMDIDAKFELVSPSNTVKPILGSLEVRNDESNSRMNSLISWQEKEIVVNYEVESAKSSILIKTPFEGIEKTKLQYSLIRTINDLLIEIEIDILNQLSYALLRWSNEYNNTYNVEFEVTSPVTGRYQLFFKHSTYHGYLMENLIVNHGENNDTIFGIQINGNVVSIWDIDLIWGIKFLDHNATLSIQNSVKPFCTSSIEASWDNMTISNNLEVDSLEKVSWLIKSSILEEDFEVTYAFRDKHHLIIKIPQNFFLENSLEVHDGNLADNFEFKTPKYFGKFTFEHSHQNDGFYKEFVKLVFDKNEVTGDLKYKFDRFAIFNRLTARIRSSWKDNVDLDYTLSKDFGNSRLILKPEVSFRCNNYSLDGNLNFEMSTSDFSITSYANGTNMPSFNIKGKGSRIEKTFELQIISELVEGHVSLNAKEYALLVNLKSNLSQSQLLLKAQVNGERPIEMYFKSNIENWENLHLRVIKIDDFRNGIVTLRKNNETTTLNYTINDFAYSNLKIKLDVNISSNLEYINNSVLIVDTDYAKVYLKAKVHVYKTEIIYLPNFKDTSSDDRRSFENNLKILMHFAVENVNVTNINFEMGSKFFSEKDEASVTLNLVGNESKLDVEFSKKNWQELTLKTATIFGENIFIDIDFNYKLIQKIFEISCDVKSTYGMFNSQINVKKDGIITRVEYVKDGVEYSGKILTEYDNILWSDSELEFKLPGETYKGNLKIQIGDISNTFVASLSSPHNSNKIECVLNVHSIKKANGIFDFHLDLFETTSNKFTFDYDFESSDKKLAFNYHPDLQTVEAIKLQLTLNRSDISVTFDLPHHTKFLYLGGRNYFKDNEVSLVYEVKYNGTIVKIDVFYINKSYTQTKLEMSSNIRGYERIIFENRIDDNKIRIFIHSKFHRLSLIADKTALHQDKELFSIYYNGEPLVVIRSGDDQSYLMASSKYTNYKLTVNYVRDPAIYTFSILKSGENLISFMLLNTSSSRQISFRGKLAAPVLFPKHPEIIFNVNADEEISKLLQFAVTCENKNLFEIKWSSKLENGLYEAYFKYVSEIPWFRLRKFEIHPSLNMWNDFTVRINYLDNRARSGYFAELAIPMKTLDTKFIVEYPCLNYQCKYNFYINRTYVNVNWFLPLRDMNNVKFVVDLNKLNDSDLSFGEVLFEMDENKLEGGWRFNAETIRIYLDSDVNNVKNRQELYYNNNPLDKTLKIDLDTFKSLFNFKRGIRDLIQLIFKDLTRNTEINLTGILSENLINLTLNNSVIITNVTVFKDGNYDVRIQSDFVSEHKILSNGDEQTLFHKLITITQFLTVPFVGKDIRLKTENFDFNFTISSGNDTNTYTFKRLGGNKFEFISLNFNMSGTYDDTKGYLGQFLIKGPDKILNLKLDIKENYVDSLVLISNNPTVNINAHLEYKKIKNSYLINANIPLSLNEYVKSESILSFDNNFSLNQTIVLPDLNKILITSKGEFLNNQNYIELHVLSHLTDDYHGMVTYDGNENDVNLAILSSLGNKNITITCNIIPKKELSIILRTPFSGFTSASLEAKFDEIDKIASLKIFKETYSLDLEGAIKNKSNSIYELNMISKNSNDSIASIQIKLDRNAMKFNADLYWDTTKFLFDLNYDPKSYQLRLETPFDKMKNLKLSGSYLKNDNSYNLEGNGNWDTTTVDFSGNLNLEPNNFRLKSDITIGASKGHVEMNIDKNETRRNFVFSGFYPKPSSNVFLSLKSQFDDLSLKSDLSMKTTFENLRNASVSLMANQSNIEIKTLCNIMREEVSIDVVSQIQNNSIRINSNLILPNKTVSSELYLDIYRSSYFKMDNFFVQYDIENKYLFKVMCVDAQVIFEFAHEGQKGEVFAQVRNFQLETSYTLWKELKSNLKNNQVSFDLDVSQDNFKFIQKHFTGHYVEVTYLNNFEIFKLGFSDSSYDLTYTLEAHRDLNKLIFQFEKLFYLQYNRNKGNQLLIFETKDYLRTKFNSSKTSIEFEGQFPKLNEVKIIGKLHREKLFAETIFRFLRNQKNLIHFKELHDGSKMGITFEFDDLYVMLNHEYKNSKMTIKIKKNPIEISYEFSDLGFLKFSIKSPSLENGGFDLFASVNLPLNATFHVSSMNKDYFAKFQSAATPNSFCLNFEAPHNQMLSLAKFETSWGIEIFKTLNLIEIESSKLGNVSILGNFHLKKDGLDIETHLRVPFLENFEKFDGEVHIHRNLTPWFYVTLPNNRTYSVKASYVNDLNAFRIDLGFLSAEKTYGFKIDYHKDNTLISAEVITPFDGYRHYGFGLEKNNNTHFLTLNINERIYNLNTKSNLTSKLKMLTINLETPFKNYEKYYFEIHHEDGLFNSFLFYPSLKRPIGFGFNAKIQFGFSFKISLPRPIHDFEYSAFEVKVIPEENENLYNVSALSELNDRFVKLNFIINNNKPLIYSVLETNNNTIVCKMNDIYENYLALNNNYVYNVNLYDSLHFYLDLYYRKLSFTYDYYVKNFQIKIWNPEDYKDKIGCHFIRYADETSIGLYWPSKILVIDQEHFRNATKFIYGVKIFWNDEKVIGFKGDFSYILSDFSSKLNLFIPHREFELQQNLLLNEPLNGVLNVHFKWDKNKRSQISYKGVLNDRHLESVFSAGFLNHDIIFRTDFTKLNELPFGFTLEIEYSNNKQKNIHLEMFYNKTFVNNVTIDERKFVLRQVYSKLDHTFISKAVTSEKYTNISAHIQYVDFTVNKPEFMRVSLEIGREEFEISGAIVSKKNSLMVYSKSITDAYSKGLQLKFKINHKEPLNLNYLYVYKDSAPSFELLTSYGEDRYYHFYMGIPNKKEITARLIHNVYGKEVVDGLVMFKLNTTSLLWTKILWKTNTLHRFYKTIIEEYSDIKYVVIATGRQLIDVINDETGRLLVEEYKKTKQAICSNVEVQISEVMEDFQNLHRLCDNNTLYCRDVLNATSFWFNLLLQNLKTPIFNATKDFYVNLLSVKDKMLEVFAFTLNEMETVIGGLKHVRSLKESAKNMLQESFEDAKVGLKSMQTSAKRLIEEFRSYLISTKGTFQIIFQPVINLVNEFYVYFERQNTYVQIIVLDTINGVQSYVFRLREVKELGLIYNQIMAWVSSVNPLDFLAPVWEVIEITVDTIVVNVNYFCDEYVPYVSKLKSLIFENASFPKVEDFKNVIENSYGKVVWVWNYYNTTNVLKSYIITKSTDYFKMIVKDVFGNTKEGLGIFDYMYKPDAGIIEVSQRLPIEWESFETSPKFEQHPLYNHIFQKISSFTLDKIESIVAKIQMLIYTILHTTIKPASNNLAMIIGKQHFITFNNKHFDFNGDCSYLLINNFDSNSFSVVLNSGQNRSLTITTHNDSVTINISEDAPIIFNSNLFEFPLINENVYIYREDERILFSNNQGLSITCDMHYDYCTFKVSEWLFGKIGGMLGTMDNEPSTDIRKPNGSTILNIEDFAESWRARQCPHYKTSENITEIKIPTFLNNAMNTICSQTFLISNSSLSSCFSILDPKPFYELCLAGIKISSKSMCSSIAAYKQICGYKHVAVKMPEFCVSCNLGNEDADLEGERIFDGHNPKTVDVVFIQERGCLPNVEDLKGILNEALTHKGFIKNRFSTVLYGGDALVKSFLKTTNGSIWANNTTSSHNLIKTIQSNTDTLAKSKVEEAIKYAAKLEFRPAVTKHFVLVQCNACPEISHSPELYNLLGEKDIILHIVKPNPFDTKDLLAIDSTKYRIDGKGILNEVASNEKLMDSLKDMCCGLALSTFGTVSKSTIFKEHTQKWAELVAGTSRTCSCQKCRCIQKPNGVGKTDCNRCMSPLVQQLLNEYESQHLRL